jgi:hypothetical protein
VVLKDALVRVVSSLAAGTCDPAAPHDLLLGHVAGGRSVCRRAVSGVVVSAAVGIGVIVGAICTNSTSVLKDEDD